MSCDNGVPESTIQGWLRYKVAQFCRVDSTDRMKKNARTAKDQQFDKAVFTWCVKERQGSIPISGPVLSVQAYKSPSDLRVDNPSDIHTFLLSNNLYLVNYKMNIVHDVSSSCFIISPCTV